MNSDSSSLPAPERVFGWREHTALWFSLGVGLLVMQVGAYLVPAMGTRDAALAVVGGSILGAGLLAWVAWLGCTSGQTSAGLIRTAYGQGFARLRAVHGVAGSRDDGGSGARRPRSCRFRSGQCRGGLGLREYSGWSGPGSGSVGNSCCEPSSSGSARRGRAAPGRE